MNVTPTAPGLDLDIIRDNEDINLLESNSVGLTVVSEPSLSHDDVLDLSDFCSESQQPFIRTLIGEAGSGDGKIRLALQRAFFIQSQN